MDAGTTRLLTLRVAEVMAKEVITVSKQQSLAEVAEILIDHRIHAAPVVDDTGLCCGIISSTDFMRCARDPECFKRSGIAFHDPKRSIQSSSTAPEQNLAQHDEGPVPLAESTLGQFTTVSEHMVNHVQTIPAGASLISAARMMCTAHLHHLPVVAEDGRPVGFLSTLDVVSAMVNAIDEAKEIL